MLIIGTRSATRPYSVAIENLQGKKRVILADNIKTVEDPEYNGFIYDEVIFELPPTRQETVESITANFADWWMFGSQPEEKITLEDRVSIIEDVLLSLMEG